MTELDHKTFDLGAVLAGVKFPEEEIPVYFDETVGYEIYKAEQTLRIEEIRGNEDKLKEILAEVEELKSKVKNVTFKITVRGIPESTRKACDAKAREKYPVEYNFLGQAEPSPDRDDHYNALLWAVSIVKIEDPTGAVAIPTEDQVFELRRSVGRSVISSIVEGINDLVAGVKSGFESAAQDVDFLSEASPEA